MAFVPQGGRVRFVLVEPSHAGNIGSAARAINTMGFTELYVVNPRDRDYKRNPEALSFCTRSADVLFRRYAYRIYRALYRIFNFAYALSGYDREFGPPFVSLTEALPRGQGGFRGFQYPNRVCLWNREKRTDQ